MFDKSYIRQYIKQLKQTISSEERAAISQEICRKMETLPLFDRACHILLYHALPDEVDTTPMLERWNRNKQLYLPVVDGDELLIRPYKNESMRKGAFGIWEPDGDETADPDIIDWIIVPGVAFDRQRHRLGRGKGFYDRLLQRSKAAKTGIAYGVQLLDSIPNEPHDIEMDMVVTETEVIGR